MKDHIEPSAGACCGCDCGSGRAVGRPAAGWKKFILPAISLVLLLIGVLFGMPFLWYLIAFLPVGLPVIREAWEVVGQKDFFNEYTLMLTATAGAFVVGEYPEAVAVMLFYSVGELFQESALNKAQNNIKALLDIRPDSATVIKDDGIYLEMNPADVEPGATLLVKAGGKVPLDGMLLSASGSFNTSALTGESRPRTIRGGETVLAGMISIDRAVEIRAEKRYADSSLARILEMVREASSRKAKTELLIRRFAKVYTPVVFMLAVIIALAPYFFVTGYVFHDWLYRALIFLVISCPCALVISVPLGYFGGIGAASRNGILFKGANFLDLMTSVNTVVMDKTGTLTKGVFKVQDVVSPLYEREEFLDLAASLERYSTHPVAKAIVGAAQGGAVAVTGVEELAGLGVKGYMEGKEVMAGNRKLMRAFSIPYDEGIDALTETAVVLSVDRRYAGYILIADEIKEDARSAIYDMRALGISHTVMLSGDRAAVTRRVAAVIGIDEAHGDLLPEDKVRHMEALRADPSKVIAFVGDGINDAPVIALSDVGIAMGGMGSDAAIEIADVVIPTDRPSGIAVAIRIAKATRRIVMQNIVLAIGVKFVVMALGALGIATMWEAVFADVGVALLAILNSVRILSFRADR